ncbi:hypothetical protein NDU88_006263 [Pleurodeles waltl]|uniref:Uncharacterized protein n=1 Tax=Pleurodeles waltl TaxID=8319 RepID=A0AAV7TDS3_PLEWA|nr:hypothetical protein NDU88_006263 [Pleurodeles waltl]
MEEGDPAACIVQHLPGAVIDENTLTKSPFDPDGQELDNNGIDLALVLQKVEEVKSLVLMLTGLMKEKVTQKCGCKCQLDVGEARGVGTLLYLNQDPQMTFPPQVKLGFPLVKTHPL